MNDLLQASLPENKFDEIATLELLHVASRTTIPFPHENIPMMLAEVAQAVATHTSAADVEKLDTMVMDEPRQVSK